MPDFRLGLVIGLMALSSTAMADPAAAPSLAGDWQSVRPEPQGKIFVTRAFHLTDKEWSVAYHAFADAQASQPLFSLDVGGVYVVGGASVAVDGAFEGIFPATSRNLTADSDAGVAIFSQMGCALRVKEAKALVSEPCGFVPPLMQAMGEYDLIALKDDQLFFGDRSGDLTKARPTALYPFPLVRK